jgi:pimeloyl-ACP methyl ester carboxylesterase
MLVDLNGKTPVVVLLPGLGADDRLFDLQREAFPDLCTLRWLPPQRGEGLDHYAARLAAQVVVTGPLILGGCSFGGMVAYEMARTLRPKALVLIGSAVGPSEIPIYLRGLSLLSSVVPAKAFGLTRLAAPLSARLFGLRKPEQRVLFAEMLGASSVEFLRWACASIGRWKPQSLTGVPIFTIHGEKDRILPLRGRSVDVSVPGAGHLLPVTDAETVNDLLLEVTRRLATATER